MQAHQIVYRGDAQKLGFNLCIIAGSHTAACRAKNCGNLSRIDIRPSVARCQDYDRTQPHQMRMYAYNRCSMTTSNPHAA